MHKITGTLFKQSCPNHQIRRSISSCLHLKGLPVTLSNTKLFNFFQTNYGPVEEIATFEEAPKLRNDNDVFQSKKKHHINHNRPPGLTAVVSFRSTDSAIMCKEDLHWRPFPILGFDEEDKAIFRPFLEEDMIETNPRDRPIVNILFETKHMRDKLRNWVKRDLKRSRELVKEWNKNEAQREQQNIDDKEITKENNHKVLFDDKGEDLNSICDKIQADSPKDILEDDIQMDCSEQTGPSLSDSSIFDSMKLVELQAECKSRNLPYYGKKALVIQRLKDSL